MEFRITALDIKVASAYQEFNGIAASDIRSAHDGSTERLMPSEAAIAIYDEVARQAEAHSDLIAEQYGA
jgi:hypothetical protein